MRGRVRVRGRGRVWVRVRVKVRVRGRGRVWVWGHYSLLFTLARRESTGSSISSWLSEVT